ncbi:DUF4400 domain-containing protein [Psychromonas sp. KJ10-2]|uniref:DUF4400 domain-containing protein n=1 Tax=Psychromonas sp. KJ10-2 TaxID=3391822 RepID=UPI0039B37E7A
MQSFKSLILPKTYIDKYYAEEEVIPISFWRYLEVGIDNFLYSIRFSILRVVSFSAWAFLFSLLMFGAIVSGYYQREIKKQGFEYSSPMRHGLARKGIYVLPLILYVLIFIPVAVHPLCNSIRWNIYRYVFRMVRLKHNQKTLITPH